MNKPLFCSLLLTAAMFLSGCTGESSLLSVDFTEPVSDQNRVIYQLNVGAFTPEGTFCAAQQQLDRLDTLGVDILWLMPVYPRGATMDSPYASMDFRQVNPAYGTVSDMEAFVAAAHERGMKVWLDWVPNHVAVENPWVTTHPEYFTHDAGGQMIHPHGWGDVYELNYQNVELVETMNEALKFWVSAADIDGFRFDYVSSPTIPLQYWHDVIRELKEDNPSLEFLSEADITSPENHRINPCGFDYDYAWDFQSALAWRFGPEQIQADSLRDICQELLRASKTVENRRMVYLTNHDQNYNDGGHTLKDFYGDNRYNLTVLEFTFYGMPLLYQGQEIGDPDTLNYFTDARVQWNRVDPKMLNTVRTLIALHHTQSALAADAPVSFVTTSDPHVLAYQRGPVLVVLNLGKTDVLVNLCDIAAGSYDQWLSSATITQGPSCRTTTLAPDSPVKLEAGGYSVYVRSINNVK